MMNSRGENRVFRPHILAVVLSILLILVGCSIASLLPLNGQQVSQQTDEQLAESPPSSVSSQPIPIPSSSPPQSHAQMPPEASAVPEILPELKVEDVISADSPIALPPRSVSADTGYIRVVMTDAPADFGKIFFDISEMALVADNHKKALTIRQDIMPLELFRLKEHPVIIIDQELEPGVWQGIFIKLTHIEAYDRRERSRRLELSERAKDGILIPHSIRIRSGYMTLILLDFDARRSLILREGRDVLQPMIMAGISEGALDVSPTPHPTKEPITSTPTPMIPSNLPSIQPLPSPSFNLPGILPSPTNSPILNRRR